MKKIIIILLLIPCLSFADNYGNVEVDKVISVYDGDTFRVDIKDYPPIIGQNMGIRIAGIDTPEMRDKNPRIKALAKKAKWFAYDRLKRGRIIILKKIKRGKYFRIVAEVWIDGVSLGDELVEAGLAKRYDGGKKSKWK